MATSSTPGARSRQLENMPLSNPDKPPLTRDASVIQQVSNFIGIPAGGKDEDEEKAKWTKKRLRRIANKYGLNENEVRAMTSVHKSLNPQGPLSESGTLLLTPGSPPEDVERGIQAARVGRTPGGRVPIAAMPSLPNYESTSTSFEGQRIRADSFSQTADLSASQSRLSRMSSQQRESVPTAVINSVTNFFKKGSFINKNRLKLRSSFASKCSFDLDMVASAQMETPEDTTTATPASDDVRKRAAGEPETSSPDGIMFHATGPPGTESFEMKTFSRGPSTPGPSGVRPSGSPRREREEKEAESQLITSEIPEETSFEVEMEEMADVDEAQGGEMDPSAMSRMTAKVRKKSSIRIPAISSRDPAELSTRSAPPFSVLQRGKTTAPPERPSDLTAGTRPLIHPSASLPSRDRRIFDEEKIEAGGSGTGTAGRGIGAKGSRGGEGGGARRNQLQISIQEAVSNARGTFNLPGGRGSDGHASTSPAGAPPPELDAYHPDIAQSPPTSAKLATAGTSYQFDPITVAETPGGVVGYHQEGNITYIDLGDATLYRPKATVLGRIGPMASSKPDRPLTELESGSTSSRRLLIRQPTIEELEEENPQLRAYRLRQKRMQAQTSLFTQKITEHPPGKRQRGIGVFGKCFGRAYKRDLSSDIQKILSDGVDERAWFTYWTTTIQIVICLLSIAMYGMGPFGMGMRVNKDEVRDVTLSNRRVSYQEPENMWFGPHYADLIRLGALYSPCMRREHGLWAVIEEERRIENRTGCCIASDHSGCWQSSELICPRNVARWVRWDKPDPTAAKRQFLAHKSKSEGDLLRGHSNITSLLSATRMWKQQRKSGAVCGQDPSYCDVPSSVAPHEWPDDITQWPICEQKHVGKGLPEHVTCHVTGRPCCIQLQGLCRIATKEYCEFVRGHWHENATLCSQVNCFSGVCGMFPFFGPSPNQFYRLFFSLFIHAGILHLAFTFFFQWWAMTDLERLIGSKRMAILYFVSGVGGNLASAIFVPYNPEVGPSGSQCGIMAALIVDCWHHRHVIKEFSTALNQHLFVTAVILIVGLVPWIDNWAHLFGFIFGLLTTIIIFPYLDFPEKPLPPAPPAPLPSTPMPRGGSALSTAETPKMAGQYSQLANGYPSPIAEPGNTMFQPIQMVWGIARRRFVTRRTFYVVISGIVLVTLFLILLIVFFGNVEIDCPWCIYFNCVPPFSCHNQGQKLKKWLPI
ncbi:unnamed protein product [Caenorhabditis sp. 36 PRJEB53466]|nr:unnamed protein product [Caenorhabditis sp. 36 PRJEB53466]